MLINLKGRVVGMDCHPDTFTAALLEGKTPAAAIVQNVYNKISVGQLSRWTQKYLTRDDLVVMEASGNSFHVARLLKVRGRKALVLESCHLGKLKEAHANNDKISAVRIGKAYLAGTTKSVWIPDLVTQERRDIMHTHRKAVKRHTQMINRLDSYLSDNGVRLEDSLRHLDEPTALEQIRQARTWSGLQLTILETFAAEVQAARAARQKWQQVMAMTVVNDPVMLSLTRLTGIRDITAFSAMAVIGDINRFKRPKSLVKYVGLNPCFSDSGNGEWSGGVGGHGRKDLRALFIESAQCILRSNSPLGQWGRRLMARKSSCNLAVAAVARKLVVAIWYLLQGKWESLEQIDRSLPLKIGKMISTVGQEGLQAMNQDRKSLRQQMEQTLKTGRVYYLDPTRVHKPKPPADAKAQRPPKQTSLAEEYGLK